MARSPRLILCPYCGHTQPQTDRCIECGGLFEPLSRKATQITMGPWFIRDKRMPFRPGCSFEIVARMVKAGKVTSNTVLRGPTTHQFWSVARNVPGIAHLLGYCHKCGAHVKKEHVACPSCDTVFPVVDGRDRLGLVYASKEQAGRAQRELNREVAEASATTPATPDADDLETRQTKQREREAFLPGPELLHEVMGTTPRKGGDAFLRPPTIPPATIAAPASSPPPAAAAVAPRSVPPAAAPVAAVVTPPPPADEHGALDFAPFDGEDGFTDAEAAGAATGASRKYNVTAIALVAVNVVVLLIIALVAIQLASGNDEPAAPAVAPAPSPPQSMLPGVSPPTQQTSPQSPAPSPRDAAPSPVVDNTPPVPKPTPKPDTTNATATPPANDNAATQSNAVAALARARALEDAGDFEGALAELQLIAEITPLSARPPELGIAMRRLEGEIKRKNMDIIFMGVGD